MISKFETKSNRVKGLSFHPKQPWILASLHNGTIQLWDHRMGTLLEKFTEHDGPVRGVCFHLTQPVFVSGGDDYKIKVWNYHTRRCLYTLYGHLDYIRTVQFHHEEPWILSASDDQTIRIWNWLSRQCIAVLTGHNHYVMCAQFHPKKDLIVSASLDQTVRVWDFSGLISQKKLPTETQPKGESDLFGNSQVFVKFVLDGHERGVNWASFHPNMPLIVSGGDDRAVKIWRMSEYKAWEVDTLRTHVNNVSCVIVHPTQDIAISNSEDYTIRLWDLNKRQHTHTFRRDNDRFWIVTSHPTQNLLAAGHDSGLIVFKLERERPAYIADGPRLFFVEQNQIRMYDVQTKKDTVVMALRSGQGSTPAPKAISYNPFEKMMLLLSVDSRSKPQYEMVKLDSDSSVDNGRHQGNCPVWTARNRFAFIDSLGVVNIRDIQNKPVKTLNNMNQITPAELLFQAHPGHVLVRCENRVFLVDVSLAKVVGEVNAGNVKYVYWSNDGKYVALVAKHVVTIATRNLEHVATQHETVRIKSGVWSDGVFLYNTLSHIMYLLPNGDGGIVQCINEVLYMTHARGNNLWALDAKCRFLQLNIDTTDYTFKRALLQQKFDEVLRMLREANLCGQAMIAYLTRKGFPEIALHFVNDDHTRFNLALQCGNIEVAEESATKLDKPDAWERLAEAALKKGELGVVERCYRKTRNSQKLTFLYLITGNLDKLRRMAAVAEARGDVMGRFQVALYLGDAATRTKILTEAGHNQLAYLTAKSHGLEDVASEIAERAGEEITPDFAANADKRASSAELLLPPTAIMKAEEWPKLVVPQTYDFSLGKTGTGVGAGAPADVGDVDDDAWGGDDLELNDDGEAGLGDAEDLGGDEAGGWGDDDELDDLPDVPTTQVQSSGGPFSAPMRGESVESQWERYSGLAAEQIAAGSFDLAMKTLHNQIGIVNFAPLKQIFMHVYIAAHSSVPTVAGTPSLPVPLCKEGCEPSKPQPMLALSLKTLAEGLSAASKAFSKGQFGISLSAFRNILLHIPFLVVESRQQVNEVRELLTTCREYITALRLVMSGDEEKDPARKLELTAYFTHCKLQPFHMQLSHRKAMMTAYQSKNYVSAGSFARRLIDLTPPAEMAEKARKVMAQADKLGTNAHQLQYDERNPFVICSATLTPIYKGHALVQCPFCGSPAQPEHKETVCQNCSLSKIGAPCSGLHVSRQD
eukprot:Rmarinus@m.17201